MHFSSRVLSELEHGLTGRLRFSFHRLDARTLRQLRVGDPIAFEVRVGNDSGLPLRDIRGTLRPGARTRFAATTFLVDRLGPGDSAMVALVQGVFRGPVAPDLVDDGLARVAVSMRVDLSHLLFEEWDKAVQLTPTPSDREAPSRPRAPRTTYVKGIPLSAT